MLFQGKKINCVINYKNKNYSFDLEKHRTVNDLYNVFTEKCPDKNYPFIIMFSPNKNIYSEITNLDTALLTLEKDKNEKLLFQFIKSFKCPSCQTNCDNETNIINKYCLNCNQYVCSSCSKQKEDSKHKDHYLINIDQNNLKDSIKLWNINLNAELSNQITFFNRQLGFLNEKDFEIKSKFWIDNILKKIKYYENLLNEIKKKLFDLQSAIKDSENILNKAMSNLTKSEQEINTDIFSKDKMMNKFFSFSEAEQQIQKLKRNYNEINCVKSKMSTIIDSNNIKKYEELLYDIPRFFDDLSKTAFLILEDLKNFEQKIKNKKQNKKERTEDRSRKIVEPLLYNKSLLKTANDAASSLIKIKNQNPIFILDNNNVDNNKNNTNKNLKGKKTADLSMKIKEGEIISKNNGNIGNNKIVGNLNLKNNTPTNIVMIKRSEDIRNKNKNVVITNRRKSSDIKLLKNNNGNNGIGNCTDSSRYTSKTLKLPKIVLNDNNKEKDKKNRNS